MKTYPQYLEKKGLSKSTINQYVNGAQSLLDYSHKFPQDIGYQDLIAYIDYLKRQQRSKRYINHRLGGIRHYFAYLMYTEVREDNPAQHLKIKGQNQGAGLPFFWMNFEELDALFVKYEEHYPAEETNQIILSLLIYQGLLVSELRTLKAEDIELKTGKIHLSKTGKTNARTLSLDLRQMYLFVKFLGGKTGLLFYSPSPKTLPNRMSKLMKQLKTLSSGVQNSKQIRGSVIVHWLKTEDLRIVQYKAGHRYVSSTERYQMAHLEVLKEAVASVHPLK